MQIQRGYLYRLLIIMSLIVACNATASSGQSKAPRDATAMTINFAGVDYLHRWSKDNQNEFTPLSDSNLAKWQDMVTIILYKQVTDATQLAETANQVLTNYQQKGEVLRTDSKPRTVSSPAEHLLIALLGDPTLMEAVFARFILIDGAGVLVLYAHREYGSGYKSALLMGNWLETNAAHYEKALMAWNSIPKAAVLSKLPQSKTN